MITLIIAHSSENSLSTHVVKVNSESSANWVGVYGDLNESDSSHVEDLLEFLKIKYDNSYDNLHISEMLNDSEISNFIL